MHSTIRVEVLNESGLIVSTGTGFFFSFTLGGNKNIPVIVTNKHVVRGARIGRLVFTVAKDRKPVYGEKLPYIIEGLE